MNKSSGAICLGYRCRCGEEVVVLRVKPSATTVVQRELTVTCPQGHTSTVMADKLELMDVEDDRKLG